MSRFDGCEHFSRDVRLHQRVLLDALMGLCLLFILAACAQSSQTPDESMPTAQHTETAAAPAPTRPAGVTPTPMPTIPAATPTSAIAVRLTDLRQQRILFWHPFQGAEKAFLNDLAAQFSRENEWGIQVQAVSQNNWGDFDEKMRQVNPAGADQPDILAGYNYQALTWDAGGWLLADQNQYVNDPQWGLTASEVAGFYPAIWAQDFVPDGMLNGKPAPGGKRLGLPWYQTATVLLYNKQLGVSLGFANPPQTLKEIQTQVCAASRANAAAGASVPGWLLSYDGSVFSSFVFAFGGEIALPDRSGYQFNTDKSRQMADYVYSLYTQGCMDRSPEMDMLQAFRERQALMITVSSAQLAAATDFLQQAAFEDEWIVLPFYSPDGQPVLDVYGPALLITQSNPARQLAAWLFVRWLIEPGNQAAWVSTSGALPVSSLAAQLLGAEDGMTAAALQVLDYLPYAHPEPVYASWKLIRPAQSEALDYLFIPGLKSEGIQDILKNLDLLAGEIHTLNP